MKKLFSLLLVLAAVLSGCSGESKPTDSASKTDGYVFTHNGVDIVLGEEAAPKLEALGEAANYFESPSCAFNGIDKTYSYGGVELYTYPEGDKDYFLSVILVDDSVKTPEGIYIGSTLDSMLGAYGEGYAEDKGLYTYTKGKMSLAFLVDGGEVVTITYTYNY